MSVAALVRLFDDAIADRYYERAKALVERCRVFTNYDQPWLANRSRYPIEGDDVYAVSIDQRIPRYVAGVDVWLSLAWHELAELLAMNDGLLYDKGHPSAHVDVATPLEKREVERQRPGAWPHYTHEMDGYILDVDDEKIVHVMPGQDLRQFEEDDRKLLAEIMAREHTQDAGTDDEPRDERGRWTAGATEADLKTLRPIHEAVQRGGWAFNRLSERKGRYAGDPTTTNFSIEPTDVPQSWKTFRKSPDRAPQFYDPNEAHINEEKFEDLTFRQLVPNDIDAMSAAIPQKQEPGVIYRGMSHEEYRGALKSGGFQSRGDYNIGDIQKGLTYWTSDPQMAESYASGFAPWQYKPTPSRPAVIVAVRDPGGHVVHPDRPAELGIRGAIPTSAISHVFIGRPFIMASGEQEVRRHEAGGIESGSGVSPSASVKWERQDAANWDRLPTKDYDPDELRDPHGQWTAAGADVQAWHGTDKSKLKSILKKGLTVGNPHNFPKGFYKGDRAKAVFVASDPGTAALFADISAAKNPVVLELHIPEKVFIDTFKKDEESRLNAYTPANIKPEWIKAAFTAKRKGDSVKLKLIRDAGHVVVYAVVNLDDVPTEVKDYSPDEARDQQGRWTAGNTAEDRISTRAPTVKKLKEPSHHRNDLQIGIEAMRESGSTFKDNAKLIRKGLVAKVDGEVQKASYDVRLGAARTADDVAKAFVAHVKSNLLALYDKVPEATRARSKLWYEGAHKIAERFGEKYGVTPQAASGVLAALSPQTDWNQNVDLARRLMGAMQDRDKIGFSPEIKAYATQWIDSIANKDAKAGYQENFKEFEGKKLGDFDDDDAKQSVFLRWYDEAHNTDRSYPVITPEGGESDKSKTLAGANQKVAWHTFKSIGNAISVFKDASRPNVSKHMGDRHKVRSFYNNIVDPNHGDDVTIDTHAIAAGLLKPLGGNDLEVRHGLGMMGAKSGTTGAKGIYGLYAEAYRQAAADRKVLPREMQSITWEAVRGLFSADEKGDKGSAFQERNADIWSQYKHGKISQHEAQKRVLAEGIDPPEWQRRGAANDARSGYAADARDLHGGVDARRRSEGLGRRGFGDDPGAAARLVTDAADPTGTGDLRARFRKEMDRRWNELRRTTREALTSDTFGLEKLTPIAIAHGHPVLAFRHWFEQAASRTVLQGDVAWAEPYIAGAYALGATRYGTPSSEVFQGARTYLELVRSELEAIVEAAAQQATRVIGDRGRPGKVASSVDAVLKSIGVRRSQLMISFLTVKALNAGIIEQLKSQGRTMVGVIPEQKKHTHKVTDAGPDDEPRDDKGRWTAGAIEEDVSKRAAEIKEKHGLHLLTLHHNKASGTLDLDMIIVPRSKQGEGVGSKAMGEITALADKHGLPMALSPTAADSYLGLLHGTTSAGRLKRFYKRFGFVENKGRNYDPAISHTMIRPARTKLGDAARDVPQPRGKGGKFRAFKAKPTQYKIRKARAAQRRLEALGEVDVVTAGDDDVCMQCEEIADEGPYPINTALGLIPAHPNCRCVFAPTSDVRDYDPYHEPAGTSKGGQFASAPGGSGNEDEHAAKQYFGEGYAAALAVAAQTYKNTSGVLAIKLSPMGGYDLFHGEDKIENFPSKEIAKSFMHGMMKAANLAPAAKASVAPAPSGYTVEPQSVGGAPVYILKKNGDPIAQYSKQHEAVQAMGEHIAAEAKPKIKEAIPPLSAEQEKVFEAAKLYGPTSALAWLSKSEKLDLPFAVAGAKDKDGIINKATGLNAEQAQAAVEAELITPDKLKGYDAAEVDGFNKAFDKVKSAADIKTENERWSKFLEMPETTDKEREDKLAAAVVGLRRSAPYKKWPDVSKASVEGKIIDLQQGRSPYEGGSQPSIWQTQAYRLAARVGMAKREAYVTEIANKVAAGDKEYSDLSSVLAKVKGNTVTGDDPQDVADLYNSFNEIEVAKLKAAYERSPARQTEIAAAKAAQEKADAELKAKTAEMIAKYGSSLDPRVIDVGGDEWNKQTAIRLEAEYQAAKPALEAIVQKGLEDKPELPPGESDDDEEHETPPTPESWDDLSTQQQSDIDDEFASKNIDEEINSQEEEWHNNGQAWHDAAHKVAEEHINAESTWVEEALDEYLKGEWNADSQEYEGGHPEIPFTADVLDQAIAFDVNHFSAWGSNEAEHNVVKIEFDNSALKEPKDYEPPPKEQGNLPGIEAPPSPDVEGPKHLTEDMRKGLVDYLTEKFNEQVEKEEGNLEAPDYLKESAKENLAEIWNQMSDEEKFSWGKQHTSIIETIDDEGYVQKAEPEVRDFSALPKHFDPLNETSGTDYRRTQALARYLSIERAVQLIKERKTIPAGKEDRSEAQVRSKLAGIDKAVWQAWKDSSTTEAGKLLQVAAADELGGRLRETGQISKAESMKWADKVYPQIGGYAGIKAYLRAKWETTQYLLDKADAPVMKVYRGIAMTTDEDSTQLVHGVNTGARYGKVNIHIKRNGAASTSTDPGVSNGWDGSDRVVLRIEAPRTAALSVPAYGINVHSEHEVVVTGTAWKHWDAWKNEAPEFRDVPVGGGLPVETNEPTIHMKTIVPGGPI